MKPKSPIFIVGCPRSGTTLLRLMFNSHPQIAIPDETAIFFFLYHYPGRQKNKPSLDKLEKESNLINKVLGQDVVKSAVNELKKEKKLSSKLIIDSLFAAFLKKQKKTIWGEKTPLHALYIKDILSLYPDAAIIYVSRDPRAVAASMKRYIQKKKGQLDFWMTQDMKKAALMWLNCYQSALKFKNKIYFLKHEKLVQFPESELKDLFQNYLKISFHPAMLRYYQRKDKENIPEWHKATASKPDTTTIDRWKLELSSDEISQVELILEKPMKEIGYEIENNIFSLDQKLSSFIKKTVYLKKNKIKLYLKFIKDSLFSNAK